MTRTLIAGLAVAAAVCGWAGPGAGIANADNSYGPHRWCPGQPMEWPTGPSGVAWDMSICHTWYSVGYGQGNVASNYGDTPPGVPSIWDGDNPPPPPLPQGAACPPIAFMCP